MKVLEEFTENCRQETLYADGRAYLATWEASPGFVEVPGISEIAVRVNGTDEQPILYMRWLVVDLRTTGGKEATLEALESHSLIGNDWATCLKAQCEQCPPSLLENDAIALLALIASPPAHQGTGLGTPLSKAFAQQVLTRLGVRAFWIEPVPLVENPATGIFKPLRDPDQNKVDDAQSRLQSHYQRSIGAKLSCPNYLRVDLDPPAGAGVR
jgi:hypothetical protein